MNLINREAPGGREYTLHFSNTGEMEVEEKP